MKKTLTCIVCPNSCQLEIDIAELEDGTVSVLGVTGQTCTRREKYAQQEIIDPRRNIATSVAVIGGAAPLVSVRLTSPIPKGRIFDAMDEIKKCVVTAPITAGTVIIHQILGHDSDVIATKSIPSLAIDRQP